MYKCKTDEIYHHGILGQKWGVRRFQNKDGSLTPLGRKRVMSDDAKEYRQNKKKKVYEMSNSELKRFNEQQNLEAQYKKQNDLIKKGTLALGTAAAVLGSINTIKNNAPGLIQSGKAIAENLRYQTWLFNHK